ncbi:MAG: DUF1631 family protein [Pseudomonadota bacterium]
MKSLRERVAQNFTFDEIGSGETLSHDELISFLARSRDTDSSVIATIRRQVAKENRNADLSAADQAVLSWVAEAFNDWSENFPIENPLGDQIKRLQPLAVAVAITDDRFFEPGNHDLHLLLDALQNGAVGWQVRLERAGQMLEQRIERAVEKALEWFRDRQTDLATITRELVSANERDAARAGRMVQRLAETEQANLQKLTAKREAALLINRCLSEYLLPSAIGDFFKGAWYDSAQRVLVKHGGTSPEWEQMAKTTRHLAQSVQSVEGDEVERDRQAQLLRHIPGQLRRWLVSLEHDSDATDGAIGLVEYAHLRLQHGQKLDLIQIPPLELDEADSDEEAWDNDLLEGDWYRFEDESGELRAQLVLQLANGRHLLFANFVGLKALDLSRRAFRQRLEDGFARELPKRATFSLSLLSAAGIKDDASLQQFLDPAFREEPEPVPAPQGQEVPERGPEPVPPPQAPVQTEPAATAVSGIEAVTETASTPSSAPSSAPTATPGTPPPMVPGQPPPVVAPGVRIETAAQSELPGAEVNPNNLIDPVLAPPAGAEVDTGFEPAQQSAPSSDPSPPEPPPNPSSGQHTSPSQDQSSRAAPQANLTNTVEPSQVQPPPQAPQIAAQPSGAPPPIESSPIPVPGPGPDSQGSAPAAAAPVAPQAPTAAPGRVEATAPPVPGSQPPASPPNPVPAEPQTSVPPPSTPAREVEVPMGAWLGFHDGETPIMAKLAVYDPRRDNYIFVNRKGIALRELSRAELVALIDRGLVDILETRCYFRDEVERARGEDS